MQEKSIMRIDEASKFLGVSEHTLRVAIKNKEIPFRKFSNKYYFSLLALQIWATGLNVEEQYSKAIAEVIKEV